MSQGSNNISQAGKSSHFALLINVITHWGLCIKGANDKAKMQENTAVPECAYNPRVGGTLRNIGKGDGNSWFIWRSSLHAHSNMPY